MVRDGGAVPDERPVSGLKKYFAAKASPYIVAKGTSFFERKEVRDAVGYLRLLANPRDEALERVVNMPPRGIGATSWSRVIGEARASNQSVWEIMQSPSRVEGFLLGPPKPLKRLSKWFKGGDRPWATGGRSIRSLATFPTSCSGSSMNLAWRLITHVAAPKRTTTA